jgi:hypothetical protein
MSLLNDEDLVPICLKKLTNINERMKTPVKTLNRLNRDTIGRQNRVVNSENV